MQRSNQVSSKRRYLTGFNGHRGYQQTGRPAKITQEINFSWEEMNRKFKPVDWRQVNQDDRNDIKWALRSLFKRPNVLPQVNILVEVLSQVKGVVRCIEWTEGRKSGILVYMNTRLGAKRFFTTAERLEESILASGAQKAQTFALVVNA